MKIAVIGGGSWATALVKILTENADYVGWWLRNPDNVMHIKKYHHNPNYLSSVELPTEKIDVTTDLDHLVKKADTLIFAVPSAFLKDALSNLKADLKGKMIISAIKGIVPDENLIVGEFFYEKYKVPLEKIGIITGPCHAEEVAVGMPASIVAACEHAEDAERRRGVIVLEGLRLRRAEPAVVQFQPVRKRPTGAVEVRDRRLGSMDR